ncbi:MAG TPA: GNAT family N-acetyltransferase [Bryobacteraceae bacterium]|nr:GNAT family N-acetyltransferase [Bryobacteraceae bacterium]
MPAPHPAPYVIEPLGGHDRAALSCGIPELDRYLHSQASQDARRKVAVPFVMVGPAHEVIGYYTLSAYTVRLPELPPDKSKNLPRYPLLPATLLGRLAISNSHRGRKLGSLLLMDALDRSWKSSAEIASIGVVAEAINAEAREFYLHHQFIPLIGNPHKLCIAMTTLAKLFA